MQAVRIKWVSGGFFFKDGICTNQVLLLITIFMQGFAISLKVSKSML